MFFRRLNRLSSFLALFLLCAVLSAQETHRFALVIGNSDYRRIDSLVNPVNDAADIAERLQRLGFEVELKLDAGNAEMGRAVTDYVRRLSSNRNNEGFFWYAGHGVQIEGENYLLPVDIDANDDVAVMYGSYPLNRLLQSLEQTARNKLNVVVVDACRDNPFKNLTGRNRSLSRGLVTVEHPPQDLFIMFSTAPGTVAADGEQGKRNSPFAEAFLKHIDSPEILPVVASRITRETMELTGGKQRPFQNGSIISEIYYSLNPAASPANAAAVNTTPGNVPVEPASAVSTAGNVSSENIEPTLVRISGGNFSMGSPALEWDRHEFYETAHTVTVQDFFLMEAEVTVGEFRLFAEETGYKTSAEISGGAYVFAEGEDSKMAEGINWRNPGFTQGEDQPVTAVSWFDAVEYCNWLSRKTRLEPVYTIEGTNVRWNRTANGFRLPTEAEWEYACRAGTVTPFNTGNRITTAQANYNGNQPYFNNSKGLFRKRTSPVKTFPPNSWGIYDMHGNVWEWCWDWFGLYRESVDDLGSPEGEKRIVRGGSWFSSGKSLRSANREWDFPDTAGTNQGFRAARSVF